MSLRSFRYSTDLLTAEVFAAPFWMPEALSGSITQLNQRLDQDPVTTSLFRATENYLLRRFPSTNLDELTSVRDLLWFPWKRADGPETPTYELHNVALSLPHVISDPTNAFLDDPNRRSPRARTAAVKVQEPDNNRLQRFRRSFFWMSTALPQDFLASLIRHESRKNQSDGALRICTGLLDSSGVTHGVAHMLRSRGLAETHLHLGAAFRFSDLWSALMVQMADKAFTSEAFASPGAGWDEGRQLGHLCLYAGLIRGLLAQYLSTFAGQKNRYNSPSFQVFVEQLLLMMGQSGRRASVREIHNAIAFCHTGTWRSTKMSFRHLQAAYRQLQQLKTVDPQTMDELRNSDPISRYFGTSETGSAESHLLRTALRKLDEDHQVDDQFATCFWQYQRIRNAVYRHIVLRPMIPGLQWFIRHYERLWPANRSVSADVRLESAREICGKEMGLRSLEVRLAPPSSFPQTLKFIKSVDEFARKEATPQSSASPGGVGGPGIEVGVVFHLIKNRSNDTLEGRANANGILTAAEPGITKLLPERRLPGPEYGSVSRFHRFYLNTLRSVRHVEKVLAEFPLSLQVVRGFDACTDELGIPNWVLVPFYKKMRRAAAKAQQSIQQRFSRTIPIPRSTIHAGEDFVHILTGLKNLDEAIDWLALEEGDRIGHALSLGVDANLWARESGNVTMQAEQRMLDLVWEWDFSRQAHVGVSTSRIRHVKASIEDLSEYIFGTAPRLAFEDSHHDFRWPPSPRDLSILRRNLADEVLLQRAGFTNRYKPALVPDDYETLLMREYLFRRDIFRRGQKNVVVNSSDWAEDLAAIQQAVRRKVERLGVAIEVNPSSNLLIGDLGDLNAHPLWRLNNPDLIASGHALPIVVGSDDPVTFASTLPQEYQKLADALGNQGFSETAVLDWLDRVRETGMRYRFTLPVESFIHRNLTHRS